MGELAPGFLPGLWLGVLIGASAGVFVLTAAAVWAVRATVKALLPILGDWIERAMP